jgi:hypothetical protein
MPRPRCDTRNRIPDDCSGPAVSSLKISILDGARLVKQPDRRGWAEIRVRP